MIRIPQAIYDRMMAHASQGYPNEACGILAADAQGKVSEFYAMKNADLSAISYFMDPKEQLQVFKDMRAKSYQMCGIFHSHVASEAYPSQKDVRLAFYPDVSYLIVSLTDLKHPILRSYRVADEKVTEEPVERIG